jgi:hypothetical protein
LISGSVECRVAQRVAGHRRRQRVGELRPLRPWPHETHVAAQDVPELRDFVDARGTQAPSNCRHARIVGRREHGAGLDLGSLPHRAQLPELERAAVAADAGLPVEDAAGRRHRNESRGEEEPRQQQEKRRRGDGGVEGAFGERARALQRPDARLQQRQVADDPESQPADQGLEGRRPDEQVRGKPLRNVLGKSVAPGRRLGRQDHLVDLVLLDDLRELLRSTQIRKPVRAAGSAAEHSHQLDTGPGVAANRVRDQARRRPAADDDGPAPGLRKEAVENLAPGRQQCPVDEEVDHEHRAGKRIRLRQEVDGRQRHELYGKGRQKKAQQRLAKALVVAIQAQQRQREDLHRRHDQDIP